MMKAFAAIIALTFRNAVRSHVFQLLLLLLLICVTVIPFSISVGKLDDLIRVSLLYSFWSVSIILSLSSLWLGCYVMSKDMEKKTDLAPVRAQSFSARRAPGSW